jgi:DNA-binding NtrC family response regulator
VDTNILAVDDQKEMLISYEKVLKRAGYSLHLAQSAKEALEILEKNNDIDLIICDLVMPEMDGMALLEILKTERPECPVIMVTGYGTLEIGVKAVKSGVFDFIEKPFSTKKLLKTIEDALRQIAPAEQGDNKNGFQNIVGNSEAMQKVYNMIRKVAYGNANVMVTGESGVGKELVARSIHKSSKRRNEPFIPINCGALPGGLFESELFGYEKGAFTGAYQAKPGLVELANSGTLFLDEICEMPLDLQVKLLRVLEDRKIRRVGGKDEIPVDIRVITATNRDIQMALDKEVLREDLYFRINTIGIDISPLRERKGDIQLLVEHFLRQLNLKYQRNIDGLDESAMEAMQSYQWPGNVRELLNVVERAYYLATPPHIKLADLPTYIASQTRNKKSSAWLDLTYKEAKNSAMEEFEKEYLKHQLDKHDWNISRTADTCEIDRRTIHRLIKRFNLKKD